MSESKPSSPPEESTVQPETARPLEITERPEYTLACQNTAKGGDLVAELLRLGVPESELRPFALTRLAGRIREGYGLDTVRSIARQAGLLTEAEVNTLFKETKAAILAEPTTTETDAEREAREARELEEMLAQYE